MSELSVWLSTKYFDAWNAICYGSDHILLSREQPGTTRRSDRRFFLVM